MSQSDFLSNVAAEYQAAFDLIDVVFPLEFCLHYQILPLELSSEHLVLGMVDPKDKETIQYVTPIIDSLGYSFHIQFINAQTHQLVLATYLKLAPKNTVSGHSERLTEIVTTSTTVEHKPQEITAKPSHNAPTLFDIPKEEITAKPSHNAPTLFDIPKEEITAKPSHNAPTLFDIPKEDLKKFAEQNINEKATFIVENKNEVDREEVPSQIFFGKSQINQIESNDNIATKIKPPPEQKLILNVPTNNLDRPTEQLKKLPPELLWEELLARILTEGIGRLYLQKQHRYGRIICSNNGVIQFSLDNVTHSLFEEIIKEIKNMVKMPLNSLEQSKKIAVQRYYNYERILLRIEFFVGKFGEEITIQVLRGQALRFYEQRQADKTIEQAIYLGQKLEKTLKKIRKCQSAADVVDLSSLKAIMRQVEKQFNLLDS